jgi:hypothetical protein
MARVVLVGGISVYFFGGRGSRCAKKLNLAAVLFGSWSLVTWCWPYGLRLPRHHFATPSIVPEIVRDCEFEK